MKKLLLVSLLFVQSLWAAAAADGGAQQIIKFKTADGQIVTYQAPGFSEMINTMVKDLPASDPNEIVDLPGLTGAVFKLVLDLCGQMESNNGLFNNMPVGVINNDQNMLDHLIQAAYVLRITVGLEHFIEALSIAWLNANHTASIIVVQNGRQACEKMGIGTGTKGKNLEQLTVDISPYVGPDTLINNLHLRQGTIAHLIHTNRMPAVAHGALQLLNRGLTVCDVWSIPLEQRHALTHLYLNENQITAVAPNAFAGLPALTHLFLDRNQITAVAANAFAGLPTLTNLFLDRNQITAVAPNAFAGLPALAHLYLNENQITAVAPNAFAGLPALTYLFLNRNQITAVAPNAFAELPALAHLYLNENQITAVTPNAFAGLPALTSLYLNRNQITAVAPNAFTGLHALAELYLSNNPELKLYNPDNLEALKTERPEWFGLPVGVGN